MSNTDTRKERTETISDLSLKLKQQKTKQNSKIRVRLTQKFKKPSYFTAHFMVFLVVFISLIFCLAYLSNRGENTDLIKLEKSQISMQKDYEKDFTSTGYTIKNPNIILNPYKNSPLTALIIFETEDEVSPTITVPGKDAKTTLTHTFVKSKKHFLPIYGLYPDTINKIKISTRILAFFWLPIIFEIILTCLEANLISWTFFIFRNGQPDAWIRGMII